MPLQKTAFAAATLLTFTIAVCSAQVDVEIIAGPNVIVDSNVLSPSTYAPDTFTVQVRYCNNTGAPIDNVYAHIGNLDDGGAIATPGIYEVRDSDTDPAFQAQSPHLANTGDYSFTHAAPVADASRLIGTLAPGECRMIYWMLCYPRLSNDGSEAVWGETRLEDDDLWLQMDAWASQPNAGAIDPGNSIGADAHVATMKNSISAMANKIGGPTGGVWTVTDISGNPVDPATPAVPGELIKVCGTGFRLGVDNKGFDTDPDFAYDYSAWIQPVGDKSLFDPFCYRLVRTEGQLRISRSGGNPTYTLDFVDQTYFRNLPNDTNGAVGDVCYFLVAMSGPCSAALSPYQLVASGAENEKFNADFGTAVPQVVSGESLVSLSKTVDLDNAAAGAQLTYDISFTNPVGSEPLGLPEYGLPLVLNETIPAGSAYVGGSAEGVVGTETSANSITAGSGGFLDVFYSTDGGASYASSEPGDPTQVTNIQWWLDSKLQASGSVFVQFQVQVDDPFIGVPLIDNTASLSFGTGPLFKEAVAGTLVSGDNAISGMVWEDVDYSNTLNSENQTAGVAVSLYYDANGDGSVGAGDILIGTQDTGAASLGADADSTYAFTNLPDGSFILVVDTSDPQIPAGYSLPDSYTASVVVDLDAAGASGTGVDSTDNDWALIPALTVVKTADPTTYKAGELVIFEIDVENHMAPVAPKECRVSGFAQRAASTVWTTPENAAGPPDQLNFAWHAASNNDDAIDFGGFDMGTPTPTDSIDSIEVVIRNFYLSGLLDSGGGNPRPDYIDIEVWDGAAWVDIIRLDYTTLHDYVGSSNQGDITITIPPAIVTAWTWATITSATQDIFRISYETLGNTDGITAFVDAVELVVSCPVAPVAPGTASPSTIDPLPLSDSYDPSKLEFVSASILPTSVDGGTGTILWGNVGPLHAGTRKTVEVTFRTLTPPDTDADDEPDPTTTTNAASSTAAMFLSGGTTNDASDTQDIDINPAGSIGDYVYWDIDGSASQTAGDLPVQGVTVELLDGLGALIASTVTDAAGFYEFTALDDAAYTVRIAADNFVAGGALEGFTQTADPDGGAANQGDVTIDGSDGISTNDSYADQDFGYDMSNNIVSGTLWYDYDGDGLQDANEPPIVGQAVTLSGVGIATTDAEGFYIFSDVPDGSYTLSTTAPGGTVLTTAANPIVVDADSPGAIDGTLFPDNDFGFQPSGSLTLGDTVYVDWDGNGSQGAGEEGIANISVVLIADIDGDGAYSPAVDTLVATEVTDASGAYGFAGLASGGDYLVVVDTDDPDFPPNLSQTSDPDATLDSTGVATGLLASDDTYDFGYQPLGSASIGDTVFVDSDSDGIHDPGEAGIALITVTLYEDSDGDGEITAADAVIGTTQTDLNGKYLFADLAPGDYLVDVDGADPQLPTELSVDGLTTLNFIPTSADPHAVSLSAGEGYAAADFGFAPGGAIGNFVWQDLDGDGEFDDTEPPISGMSVNLYIDTDGDGTGDTLIGTTTTDADGLYLFDTYNDGGTNTGLPAGDYVVEIVTSGTQTVTYDLDGDNDTDTPVALLPGQTFGAADFGVNDSTTLVIGDTVWIDSDGDGIVDEATETLLSGVKVELIAADGFTVLQTVYTDSLGNYSFGVADDGSTYSVVVDESTLPFAGLVNTTDRDADLDNDSGQFVMAGGDVSDADFGYQFSGAYDIAGTAFNDTDSSTTWQSGSEPTYADVIVYLWYSPDGGSTWVNIDSQLTGANGSFKFDGYPAGTYTVAVSPGSPVLIGTAPTTPQNLPVTVVDRSVAGVDFGFVGTSSIGDTVFYDTDGDGLQQGGETGIPGIQVTLTYPNGQTLTTTTSASGSYLFAGLGAGPYTITVDDSTLPAGTTNTGDPDGTKDSSTLVNLSVGQSYLSGDFGYQAPGEGSIGETIWADVNGDGVFDPDGVDNIPGNGDDEFGIAGVVVELYDANDPAHDEPGIDPPLATTTTDPDGTYGFSGLIAGDYLVQVETTGALAGYDATYDEDGGIATPDSLAPINLPANTSTHDTADFGYSPTYAPISGTVYDDSVANNDLIDPGTDSPIAGVTIQLWSDPDGDGDPGDGVVVATAVTDSNGNYSFEPMLPGDYVIVEIDPGGFTSDADTAAANDNRIPVDLQGVASSGNDFLDDGGVLESIAGTVYDDDDTTDDDVIGAGDIPIPGVTLTLVADTDGNGLADPGEPVIGTAVTGTDGGYSFGNLPQGDYAVVETNPPGVTSDDFDSAAPISDNTVGVTLDGNGDSLGNDFLDDGLATYAIVGQVRDDYDNDGEPSDLDRPVPGVDLTLYSDTDGDGQLDAGEPELGTTETDVNGSYRFDHLPDGDYLVIETQPQGSASTFDAQGEPLDDSIAVTISGGDSLGNDFLEALDPQGYFYLSATGEIIPGGSIGVSGPGTADISQDGATGQYAFTVDQPGTYVIAITPPSGYLIDASRPDGGTLDPTGQPDPFEVGSGEDATNPGFLEDPSAPANPYYLTVSLESGDPLVLNNNIPLVIDKPGTWLSWQAANAGDLGSETGPSGNNDGDLSDNLLEYALCLNPGTGAPDRITDPNARGGFCLEETGSATLDAFFTRPLSGVSDLTYTVEVSPGLVKLPGTTVWTDITSGITPSITPNGDGTETVRYANLELINGATAEGVDLSSGIGFARLRVDLDDGTNTATSHTEVFGWSTLSAQAECETFCDPFAPKDVFSGTVASAAGEVLDVSGSAGTGAEGVLAQMVNRPHYIELIAGTYEGHRFDVASASDQSITLATGAARNTLDPIPDLTGGQFVLRAHKVLDDVVAAAAFVDAVTPSNNDDPATAGRVLFFDQTSGWSTYFAYDDSGGITPQWTSADNSFLEDVGDAILASGNDEIVVIDPCSGFFVHSKAQSVDLLSVGVVRTWDFACPLDPGYNFVGSGYPLEQNPGPGAGSRDMSLSYFTGTPDPFTADQVEFWLADGGVFGLMGYESHFRVLSGSYDYWTTQEGSSLADESGVNLFKIQRASFINSVNGSDKSIAASVWLWPAPWAP